MSLPIGVQPDMAGGVVVASQMWYSVGELPVVRLGDVVSGHGDYLHSSPVMAQATVWYRVSGIPVCLFGHLASCGHELNASRQWFRVE